MMRLSFIRWDTRVPSLSAMWGHTKKTTGYKPVKGSRIQPPRMDHFDTWIISSWKQAGPRRLRKSFLFLLNCLKNLDKGLIPGR